MREQLLHFIDGILYMDDDSEELSCRLCFDNETDSVRDPLLRPCNCAGSMAYIHQSCLYEQRVNSFAPSDLTKCGLCRTDYRTVDSEGEHVEGAQREIWQKLARFFAVRIGIFLAVVFLVGFIPRYLLGDAIDEVSFFSMETVHGRFGDHMAKGGVGTLTLAGGWASIQVMTGLNWLRIFTGSPFANGGWTGGGGGNRKNNDMGGVLLVLIIVGGAWLLWHLGKGAWDIMQTGNAAAGAHLRHENREMRSEIARRYRVIDLRDEWMRAVPGQRRQAPPPVANAIGDAID